MSFCYVVLCHTDAGAALGLARRIHELSPTATVVLRHDRAGFITSAQAAEVGAVLFHSGLTVRWGGWSVVAATLEVLEHVQRTAAPDYVRLLSGHDYPLRYLATWEAEVEGSGMDALLSFSTLPTEEAVRYVMREPAPAPAWVPALADRAAAYLAARAERLVRPALVAHRHGSGAWSLGVRRLGRQRRLPPVQVRKASQWMTLSAAAVEEVLRADARVVDFFRTTRVPDELFFPSLLADRPHLAVADQVQTWLRFAPGAASPDWVGVDDVALAARTGAAFIRKVAPGSDDVRRAADEVSQRRSP